MKEANDSVEHKKTKKDAYQIDPAQTALFAFFGDGTIARMVKTFEDNGDSYTFYLVPTKDFKVRYAEKLKTDPDYDKVEDLYKKTIPKSKCVLLDPHSLFQRWMFLCDWNLKERNPVEARMTELQVENERLQKERDSYIEKIKALLRDMSKIVRYPQAMRQEVMKEATKEIKDLNLFNLQKEA